ncbi:MAG: electron transport complex subunit RsxG [Steroidobacter sp.]
MAIPSDARGAVARSAITLAAIGAVLAIVLYTTARFTNERIIRNEQTWIKQHLYLLLQPGSYDNDVLTDTTVARSKDLLGTSAPTTIYRARRGGQPVAAIIHSVAPDGYRGPIELLIAIAWDGTLLGVRVVRHNETPGLGDAFETREADWLDAFAGLSLSNPPQQRWTVRRDGGDFDAFTGATITPRAIVKTVRRSLEYFRAQRDRIFAAGEKQR